MIGLVLLLALPIAVLGDVDCGGKSDGTYFIGCKSYATCTHGQVTVTECQQGMVYDATTQGCNIEDRVSAPCGLKKDCSSIADGSYPDILLQCKSYYTCSRHVYFGHNYCTPGTVFSNVLKTCVWPRDADPPCGTKGLTTPSG